MRAITRFGILLVIGQLALNQLSPTVVHAASISSQLTTSEKQNLQREARLVVDLLQNSHYSGRAFREIDNRAMVARFLKELDPQADILNADSVDFIHRRFDRTFKSVYLFRGDLQPAFEIFDQYIEQARERMKWAQQRLDRGFDFSLDETYRKVTEPAPFKVQADADRHWELLLKEWVLIERLRGRSDDEATAEIKRRYAEFERTLASYDSLAVRERFFDAIIRSYDPHSGYFSSDSAREFALEMEKAVIGLGLDLRKDNGLCVVAAVQAAGSADLNSGIAPGDVIEAVAEGDGPWINLAGLRLREIVGLMRGVEGAKLRVTYRPGGTETRIETTLVRTRIVLGADRAHGAVSELRSASGVARRIGWIELPSFYTAGEGGALTSAARDIRELLAQMTEVPLDGLVVDLRDNPGGALSEAVALSELFLPRGIMMLSRGLDGQIKEHRLKETEGDALFTGPLVVLTSPRSASASEVFAGAMKYHRRAIIAGAASTYGKGTVQAYIELAKLQPKDSQDWGTLRLTTERFYSADGQSVQRTGIPADIPFPEFAPASDERREAELPGAFLEETVPAPPGISPVSSAVTDSLIARLRESASQNFEKLPEWKLYREEATLWKKSVTREDRSLVLNERRRQWDEHRSALETARQTRRELTAQLAYTTLPFEINAVRSAREIHEARLGLTVTGENPALHRLRQGAFLIETGNGRFRKLRLDAINFDEFSGDAETLAEAFATGANATVSADAAGQFLSDLSLLEHKTDPAVRLAARQRFDTALSDDALRNGVDALLQRLTELNPDGLSDRPGLDVSLRESLRLAAEWADLKEATPVP